MYKYRGVLRICPQCGVSFISSPTEGKYCSKACFKIGITIHGDASGGRTSSEYKAWRSIKTRCFNTNDKHYPAYGGRGITMCDAWRDSFEVFLADMGRKPSPMHSIDRINNVSGHYEPGNCRWATNIEQGENRRNLILLTFNGITKPLQRWARETGKSHTMLSQRYRKGWSDEDILTREWRGTKRLP